LLNGHGIGPQHDDALHWYKQSIDKGEPKAMLALGNMNEKGIGMHVDLNKAEEYYKRAAGLGEPIS
jgi:TPR repeat protein